MALSADIAKNISTVSPRQKRSTFLLTTVERVTVFLKHYLKTRNTYGVAYAGFHALRPLSLSAETTVTSFAITFGMHVHDLLTGASFQMEVKFLQGALIEHLASWFPHPQMDFKW